MVSQVVVLSAQWPAAFCITTLHLPADEAKHLGPLGKACQADKAKQGKACRADKTKQSKACRADEAKQRGPLGKASRADKAKQGQACRADEVKQRGPLGLAMSMF
ncbi:hypothetical protein J6590_071461 [Homalodisca vitripennis]|nr:hypothetical protein J6590_071461 [Homalodisca vitripennis]